MAASVGIFGQQIIPTLIMWFVAWPVLVTQIWGLIQQSELDDKSLAIAEKVINSGNVTNLSAQPHCVCSNCSLELSDDAKFCPNCGKNR